MVKKKTVVGVITIVLAYYANKYFAKSPGEIVTTKNGKVQGYLGYSRDGRLYTEWLGIPYAKPPVLELRFATPQPGDNWEGVRDGRHYGSSCPQFAPIIGRLEGSEDCLYLNVHVPEISNVERQKRLLPVMIFIHGGYFESGSGETYKPGYFMDEDVVLVTINYRLGVLGFLSTGDGVIRGNMGLKDQSLAIKWVKENIQNFGGDPEKITIFGESAGSASVHMQLLSPMTKGLVNRAISQSGSAFCHWTLYEDPLGQAKEYAQRAHCDYPSTAEIAKCLRSLDTMTLLSALEKEPRRTKRHIFVPVIEGVDDQEAFLTQSPDALYKTGNVSKVPWLTGVDSAEGLFWAITLLHNETLAKSVKEAWEAMDRQFLYLGNELQKHSDTIRQYYFGLKEKVNRDENIEIINNVVSDRLFLSTLLKVINAHKEHAPVYPYWFSKEGPSVLDLLIHVKRKLPVYIEAGFGLIQVWINNYLETPRSFKGVSHADELAMLFEMPPLFKISTSNQYYEFSKDLIKTWADFAAGKHPGFRGLDFPKIGRSKTTTVKFLEIDDKPKVIDFPYPKRLAFWDKLLA